MRKALLLLVVLATLVAGCDNKYKDPDPQAMGYDYYPIEVGNYRVYDVTDIRFRDNRGDTSRFQMRERVDTSFHDQTGQLVYKVIRSIRPNDRSDWLDDSVMVVAKTERMVLLTKDNTKYIKLVFPVKDGTRWIGDAFNNRIVSDTLSRLYKSKEHYEYADVGESLEVSGIIYPKTAVVIQALEETSIKFDNRLEVYSTGIGLINRVFVRYTYCTDSESKKCPYNIGYIETGHERHEILIDHGKL